MLPRAASLALCLALSGFACDSGKDAEPTGSEKATPPVAKTADAPTGKTADAPTDKSAPTAPTADCTGVLNTLIAKEPEASMQLTVAGQILPVKFVPGKVYPSNPVWDAGAAPSLCAAVLTPPQVEKPAMNLVGQLEIAGAPGLRIQATGVEIGEVDLSAPGSAMFTGFVLPKSGDPTAKAEALNFTAGTVRLERVEGAKSRVKLIFAGTTGKLVPSDQAFTLDGSISATVGGR